MTITAFQETVWREGRELFRPMPWRKAPSPYYVLVSEIMLQQTQVTRVIPKFEAFVQRFPAITDVAKSSLADVLTMWSGLGYNRRAKYLYEAAIRVSAESHGELPATYSELMSLPGIGTNTAGAIMNYAYEIATPFVETNIRTVYFHHFFPSRIDVTDKELMSIVASTIDKQHPREWFWALMDYGSHLKATAGGRLDQSTHYRRQSALAGSSREMRGRVVRALTASPLQQDELARAVIGDERFIPALKSLEIEGLIILRNGLWQLNDNRG